MEEPEHVPVFKSWKGWYRLLAVVLIVQIVLFYILTASFQ